MDNDTAAQAFASRVGFVWLDTESNARRMARHAATEIARLKEILRECVEAVDAGDSISAEEYHETFNEARKVIGVA